MRLAAGAAACVIVAEMVVQIGHVWRLVDGARGAAFTFSIASIEGAGSTIVTILPGRPAFQLSVEGRERNLAVDNSRERVQASTRQLRGAKMLRIKEVNCLVGALLLSSCADGEGSGYCAKSFSGGAVSSVTDACTDCSVAGGNSPMIDNSSGTASDLVFEPGGGQFSIRAVAPAGKVFSAGALAGTLMRFPEGPFTNVGVRFSTYRSGVPVDSQTGGEMTGVGDVQADENYFFSVDASGEFDELEAIVSLSGNSETEIVRLYEFCGER